jgi:excisionase family DNA binding protein
MLALLDQTEPITADETEAKIAKAAAERLRSVAESQQDIEVVVQEGVNNGAKITVPLPARAVGVIYQVLVAMGQGIPISVIPHQADLTTQQAADYLNVSRPYLCGLIDTGKIDARKVGRHRRVRFAELLAFEERSRAERRKAIDAMAAEARELDLD